MNAISKWLTGGTVVCYAGPCFAACHRAMLLLLLTLPSWCGAGLLLVGSRGHAVRLYWNCNDCPHSGVEERELGEVIDRDTDSGMVCDTA